MPSSRDVLHVDMCHQRECWPPTKNQPVRRARAAKTSEEPPIFRVWRVSSRGCAVTRCLWCEENGLLSQKLFSQRSQAYICFPSICQVSQFVSVTCQAGTFQTKYETFLKVNELKKKQLKTNPILVQTFFEFLRWLHVRPMIVTNRYANWWRICVSRCRLFHADEVILEQPLDHRVNKKKRISEIPDIMIYQLSLYEDLWRDILIEFRIIHN